MQVVAVAVALVASAAPARAATVQPGDYVNVDGLGGCTLGWLFDSSAGDVFFASAAHCFSDGETVEIAAPSGREDVGPAAGETLGTVRVRGNPAMPETDVALILVRDDMKARVTGELRGHEGIPAGVTSTGSANDALQLSGYGLGFNLTAQTRESRQGVLSALRGSRWAGVIPATGGDSGGPVAHVGSRGALGLVKGHQCSIGYCESWGPSVQGIQAVAMAAGISLSLRRANQPAPVPTAPSQPAPEPQPGPQPQPPGQPQSQPAGQPQPQPAEPQSRPSRPAANRRSKQATCRREARKTRSAKRRKQALRRCSRARRR